MTKNLAGWTPILLLAAALPCAAGKPAPYVGDTFWGTACHGTAKGQEVYDYTLRNRYASQLQLTENYHFNPNVENLISGQSSSNPLHDIDFTLTRWPNHHRALNSAIRARLRYTENFQLLGVTPAECYLQRAINFSPKDATSYMLYGNLLQNFDQLERALQQYEKAEAIQPGGLEIKYNMGLLLVKMGDFEQARRIAQDVYARNFPLPGLKRKLSQAGYWEDGSTPAN